MSHGKKQLKKKIKNIFKIEEVLKKQSKEFFEPKSQGKKF